LENILAPDGGFWQFSIGNLVTCVMLGGAIVTWIFRRGSDMRGITDTVEAHEALLKANEEWRREHIEDCRKREEIVAELSRSNVSIAATLEYMGKIFEGQGKRIERIENDFWVPRFPRK
jgi:hypothetical protein